MSFQMNADTVPSLASSAMLIDLNIGVWTGRKLDKKVGIEVEIAKNAKAKAINATKNLFAGLPELDAIRNFVANVRNWHYANTRPWSDSGTRLLPMAHYFDYMQKIGEFERTYNEMVEQLIQKYPEMIDVAAFKLADLFDRTEYPDVASIRSKFYFNTSLYPVPLTGDIRVDVIESVKEELVEQFDSFTKKAIEGIYVEQWESLKEVVEHLVGRLSDKTEEEKVRDRQKQEARNQKKEAEGKEVKERELSDRRKFHDDMIDKALDKITLLEKLDVMQDSKFQETCSNIKGALANVTVGQLKNDDEIRGSTKDAMQSILDKMGL